VAFLFLEETTDAALGKKLGLDGKSLPPRVVEGIGKQDSYPFP
jgi:hypothetical protein